jgi:7-cyano-7-deazaguanine synthase
MKNAAVVLLSGGLDSATMLALASQDFRVYALSFDYGQRHAHELNCARALAQQANVEQHVIQKIDLRAFGGSALTSDIEVPKNELAPDLVSVIPVTYVPARNTVFLSFAVAWAETLNANDIFIGVNAPEGMTRYPDCRPEYIAAYENMANLATRAGFEGERLKIHTPLMNMTKTDIIRTGNALGMDYSNTSSCYDPADSGQPCGHCDPCLLRIKCFAELGLEDPLLVKWNMC